MASGRSLAPVLQSQSGQAGFSLIGFLCTLIVIGTVGLLTLRAGPGVIEYWAVEKAVRASLAMSSTPEALRASFDRLAAASYIDAIEGKDLQISGRGEQMQVSFAYQKTVPLYGPASLVIRYTGSTAEDAGSSAGGAPDSAAK